MLALGMSSQQNVQLAFAPKNKTDIQRRLPPLSTYSPDALNWPLKLTPLAFSIMLCDSFASQPE